MELSYIKMQNIFAGPDCLAYLCAYQAYAS